MANATTRILVFGNSGSGKSTLARRLNEEKRLAHFDLDTIAWLPVRPPVRASLDQSMQQIQPFIDANESWVIEGCYGDLFELVLDHASHIVFMNLSVEACVRNARRRPWEPHKYESQKVQDENLDMLIAWINEYPFRNDVCSLYFHKKLYQDCTTAKKIEINGNVDFSAIAAFVNSQD